MGRQQYDLEQLIYEVLSNAEKNKNNTDDDEDE